MFKNTFAGHRVHPDAPAPRTAPGSSSSATTLSHLYNLAHFLDAGLVRPPLFVQTVFGILGGIGPHPEDVLHMKRTADRLFGDALPLVGAGRRAQPDADRGHGGGHGRQRPRRAGGQPVGRPRPAGRRATPPRSAARARSWKGWGWRSRRPAEARADPGPQGRGQGGLLGEESRRPCDRGPRMSADAWREAHPDLRGAGGRRWSSSSRGRVRQTPNLHEGSPLSARNLMSPSGNR